MASVTNLSDLFHEMLKDIYYAEKKILKALPKMVKSIDENSELARAFMTHREETEGQVERLEQVFALIDKKPKAKKCDAIEGLSKEAEELMDEVEDQPTLQAGLLAGAQAVEHYEIARYGTLVEWAKLLGHDEAAELLQETLEEEKKTDHLLTELAESEVNQAASDSEGSDADSQDSDDDEESENETASKRQSNQASQQRTQRTQRKRAA